MRIAAWVSLPLQFFGGGAVLGAVLSILLLFGTGETYDGAATLIGAPVVGAFIAVVAMLLAILLGIPLRLFAVPRRWWMRIGWTVALVFTAAGVGGILFSYLFGTEVFWPSDLAGVPDGVVYNPEPTWYYGSIAVAALGLAHLMIPLPWGRFARGT